MTAIYDLSANDIIDAVSEYIEPIAGRCQRSQANGVPMPKGEFCILTVLGLDKLSVTKEVNQDTGDPATSRIGYTDVKQVRIQLDIYGDDSEDRANAIYTTFPSSYAYDKIKSINEKVAPLSADRPFNAAMIDAEQQWQDRWTMTLHVQAHITVSFPMGYYDKVELTIDKAGF